MAIRYWQCRIAYLTVRAALHGFDTNLELAAQSFRAGWQQLWVSIMLLVLLPGMVGGMVMVGGMAFAFITSFDDVVMALFLTMLCNRTLPKLMCEGLVMDFDTTIFAASYLLVSILCVEP